MFLGWLSKILSHIAGSDLGIENIIILYLLAAADVAILKKGA